MPIPDNERFNLMSIEQMREKIDTLDNEFYKQKLPKITVYPNSKTVIDIMQVSYDVYKYTQIFYLQINDLLHKKCAHKLVYGKEDLDFLLKAEVSRQQILAQKKPRKPKGLRDPK